MMVKKGFFHHKEAPLDHFFKAVIKRRKLLIILFACLAVVSVILMLNVNQNYDMSKYLPDDSDSKTGIDILKDEYSYNGSAVLLLEDQSVVDVLEIEQEIEAIGGIENVVWLDDVADLKEPIELIDPEISNNYWIDDNALLQIVFTEDDNAEMTRQAIDAIKDLLGEDAALSGSAVDAYINVEAINGDIFTGILIAVAIILVILILASNAFFEVVLFLITIGVAILLNMGTNIIFGEISYMTFASASILQLAISMDYSIFLLHRFKYERESEPDPGRAMVKALKGSFSSILSSGATTVVGFIALIFMRYTIGMDMGLVLAKGIVFSLLCVMVLLPALAVAWVKALDKTKHKNIMPSMKKAQHLFSGKARYVVLSLLVIISAVCFLAQSNNTFLYTADTGGNEEQDMIESRIEETFGSSNTFVVLVPKGSETEEYEMAQEILNLSYVKSVQGLYTLIDPEMPEEMVPEEILDTFVSEHYSRYIVEVDAASESDAAMTATEEIRSIVSDRFDTAYVTGASPVIYDIKYATSGDFTLVTVLSIIFVGIILLLAFRSWLIPLILLFVIETSIWINMAVPYFTGEPMILSATW